MVQRRPQRRYRHWDQTKLSLHDQISGLTDELGLESITSAWVWRLTAHRERHGADRPQCWIALTEAPRHPVHSDPARPQGGPHLLETEPWHARGVRFAIISRTGRIRNALMQLRLCARWTSEALRIASTARSGTRRSGAASTTICSPRRMHSSLGPSRSRCAPKSMTFRRAAAELTDFW